MKGTKRSTIGRSSHRGIPGDGNRNVKIKNVDFADFEVAALALNGVEGLKVVNPAARNREDVHVIGSYSNARFIAPYLDRRGIDSGREDPPDPGRGIEREMARGSSARSSTPTLTRSARTSTGSSTATRTASS